MKRVRHDAAFWRERVQQWTASGLSARDYAAREGLKAERLWVWQRRLGAQGMQTPSAQSTSRAKPSFLPVVIAATRAGSSSHSPLEVVMRSGHTVRVPADFDDAALVRLLTVLGGA